MNVLVACECSGIVRDAFRANGHNAWSCDLKPSEDGSAYHIDTDIFLVISGPARGINTITGDRSPTTWELLIAHPPCTYLCNSGALHLYYKGKDGRRTRQKDTSRWSDMNEGALFFKRLLNCGIKRIALENPVMHGHAIDVIGSECDQTIQPYEFGDDASKRTCLWLRNLPLLKKLDRGLWFPPRFVNGKPRWSNQTDGGQNKLTPGPNRQADRARTYKGIARQMADQWGPRRTPYNDPLMPV